MTSTVDAGVDANPLLADYQLRLPAFEGPLDVLLTLIERERLDISNVSLVLVMDGFLEHVAGLDDPPPSLLAEFATIAARLLVLKSRALLPRSAPVEQDEDTEDLAAQLVEYQRVQRLAAALRQTEVSGQRSFVRPVQPMETVPAPRVTLLRPPLGHLRRAMQRVRERELQLPTHVQLRPRISIGHMARALRTALRNATGDGRVSLHAITGTTREHLVAGFIACLALTRRGEIDLAQDEPFGPIHLWPLALRDDSAEQSETDDAFDGRGEEVA